MLDITIVEEQKKNDIEFISNGARELKSSVESMIIKTQDNFNNAGDLLKRIKQFIKMIEERRTARVKPLNDYVSGINAEYKPITGVANEVKTILESKMRTFADEQRKIEEEKEIERRKIEADELAKKQKAIEDLGTRLNSEAVIDQAIVVEEKITKLETKPIVIKQTVKTEQGTTAVQRRWTYKIIDESKIPIEYCSFDPVKAREAIRKGIREIPGLEIYQETGFSNR